MWFEKNESTSHSKPSNLQTDQWIYLIYLIRLFDLPKMYTSLFEMVSVWLDTGNTQWLSWKQYEENRGETNQLFECAKQRQQIIIWKISVKCEVSLYLKPRYVLIITFTSLCSVCKQFLVVHLDCWTHLKKLYGRTEQISAVRWLSLLYMRRERNSENQYCFKKT